MRNKIFGAIGVIWGGGVLVYAFLQGGPQGQGASAAGQIGAMVFGGILLVVGLYYLIKKDASGPKQGRGRSTR
jgi:hypothetical protein